MLSSTGWSHSFSPAAMELERHMSVDFTGTWNASLTQSRLLGPIPKAISIRIEHSDPELQEEMLVTRQDGSQQRLVFKCATTGEPNRSSLNGTPVRGTARWQGEELEIESWARVGARAMYFCDYWALSPDGQTLYMEHRNDALAGQLTVLDRGK